MEQVADIVAPLPHELKIVNAWLDHHDVLPSTISKKQGGSWLTLIDVPVPQANDLLGASYPVVRTLSLGLPGPLLSYGEQTVITTSPIPSPVNRGALRCIANPL